MINHSPIGRCSENSSLSEKQWPTVDEQRETMESLMQSFSAPYQPRFTHVVSYWTSEAEDWYAEWRRDRRVLKRQQMRDREYAVRHGLAETR